MDPGEAPALGDRPLAVALDTADLEHLSQLAAQLSGHVGALKVGLEAFAAHGPAALHAARAQAPLFADLKLHDIPATVGAAAAALGREGASYLTVHATGGERMINAAVDAAPETCVLAVTVLTSLDARLLAATGSPPAEEQVPRLARLAIDAGAGGVVCAPTDIGVVREAIGDRGLVVTPGVRPAGSARDDQARVATPSAARAAGADLLVVGRPVTRADDPVAAADAILAELD